MQKLPSAYLDVSHLVDAFHGRNGRQELATLGRLVERVAHEARLCLQNVHLHELAAWKDHVLADHMSHWPSALPLTWTQNADTVKRSELREALITLANPLDLPPYSHFVGHLADVYAATPGSELAVPYLRAAELPDWLRAMRDPTRHWQTSVVLS